MKRLLLALLASISLSPAVNAGNLGLADKILNRVNATKLEETKQIYDINVGQINGKASAEFSKGKFIIRTDEKYIKKMQKEGRLLFDIKSDESGGIIISSQLNSPLGFGITNELSIPLNKLNQNHYEYLDFHRKKIFISEI